MQQEQSSGKYRAFWWATGIIAVLLLIGAVAWLFLKKDLDGKGKSVLKPFIGDQLKKLVREKSHGLYELRYSAFDLNLKSGTARFTKVRLLRSDSVYRLLDLAQRAPNSVYSIRLDSLLVTGIRFDKIQNKRKLVLGSVTLRHPVLQMISNVRRYDPFKPNEKPDVLLRLLMDLAKLMAVNRVHIYDLDLSVINKSYGGYRATNIKDLAIAAMDLYTVTDSGGHTAIGGRQIRIATPDSLYYLTTRNFALNPAQGNCAIDEFTIVSRSSKTNFYKRVKYAKDRYHIAFKNILFSHIDVPLLLQKQQLHIGKWKMGSYYTEVYTNFNYPLRNPSARRDRYPSEQLQRLAFDITVDTLVSYGDVYYKVAAKDSKETAVLSMLNTSSRICNITNNAAAKARNHFTVSHSETLLMGAGKMKSVMRFNLNDKDGGYTYNAHLGAMKATAFNQLLRPLVLKEISEGQINGMDVDVSANEFTARGNIDMFYTGMKLRFLKRDDKTGELKKRGLLTFLSNVVTPDDNPKKNGKFRKGPIYTARQPQMSFFGFMSRWFLDGMTTAMTGLEEKKEKADANFMLKTGGKIFGTHDSKKKN